jgi:hypothetical protein
MTKVDVLPDMNKPKERYKITNWSSYNSGLRACLEIFSRIES